MKKRVLFVCIHNSARSQMAEALLNAHCPDDFEAESAGLEAGRLNPYAVQAMAEIGIDISHKTTRKVFDVFVSGVFYSYVITVCDEASAERCPIFPSAVNRLHWGFPDPSAATGNDETKLDEARRVRDLIDARIKEWCAATCELTEAVG